MKTLLKKSCPISTISSAILIVTEHFFISFSHNSAPISVEYS